MLRRMIRGLDIRAQRPETYAVLADPLLAHVNQANFQEAGA
jgi:hypothetical protein